RIIGTSCQPTGAKRLCLVRALPQHLTYKRFYFFILAVFKQTLPFLKLCAIRVACDVSNPLIGDNGASRIFGPQKGATEENIVELDR
ncbi:glycerate kinase, partial [Salmonella enterica subsp. enterica serovar Kentucky]|nr:glycerate kinase [Salmonella enterica subsp. enterica serovar Kentucky]